MSDEERETLPPPSADPRRDLAEDQHARRWDYLQGRDGWGAVDAAVSDLERKWGATVPSERSTGVRGAMLHHLQLAWDAGAATETDLRQMVQLLVERVAVIGGEVTTLIKRVEELENENRELRQELHLARR